MSEFSDKMKVDIWKSDTLKAITALQHVRESSNRQATAIAKEAMEVMRFLSPKKGAELNALGDGLLQTVIKPAAELAEMMCVSPRKYVTEYPAIPLKFTTVELASVWDLKDIEKWLKLRQSGLVSQVVRRLHPALVLYSGRDSRKVLVKPVLGVCSKARSGSDAQENSEMLKKPMKTGPPVKAPASVGDSSTRTDETSDEQVLERPSGCEGQHSPAEVVEMAPAP
jgi:hypothetical protein